MIDWLIVAAATHAGIALAAWAGANRPTMSVILALLALAETGALFLQRQRFRERSEFRYLVEGLALLLTVSACLSVVSDPAPNWPYLLGLTVGVAIAGGAAIFESSPWMVLPAGLSLSLEYHVLLDAFFQPAVNGPAGRTFWVVATTVFVVALIVPWMVAASSQRLWRFILPALVVAVGNALYITPLIFRLANVQATLLLGVYVLLALVVGWRTRAWAEARLGAGAAAGFFGLLLPLPLTIRFSESSLVVAASAVVIVLVALGVRRLLGRAMMPFIFAIALWTALTTTVHVLVDPHVPATWSALGISFGAWLLLTFALLATIASVWDNLPWALFVPATFGLAAAVLTPDIPGVILTMALVATGMTLHLLRGRWWWSITWYLAALLASLTQIILYPSLVPGGRFTVALIFAGVAYLAAAIDRRPWASAVVPVYAALALYFVPDGNAFVISLALTFGLVLIGIALRLRFGRRWALACYVSAVIGSAQAIYRVMPPHPGVVEALLLIFAATAYGITLIEHEPRGGIVAVVYTGLAVGFQPDAHALLPLSLALAILGITIGRVGGWPWAWPAYAAALIAAMMTGILGVSEPGFEGWVFFSLALLTYLIALIEALPDMLVLAMFLGVLALVTGANTFKWPAWQLALAFIALSWVYVGGQWLWSLLPWLRSCSRIAWWLGPPRRVDVRVTGRVIHHAAGLLVGGGAVVAILVSADTFMAHTIMAQSEVVALVSLAAMVALTARKTSAYVLWYVAGALFAVAISWEMFWLGADNIPAFVIAPASYLLVIGVLLPADKRLHNPAHAGQWASLSGVLLLMSPTLIQSYTTTPIENWIYAGVLALEAMAITGIGVGTHARTLVLLGSGFFGLAVIRGALLAFSSGVPVALLIAALALALMGGATWLSLRPHHDSGATPSSPPPSTGA